MQPNIGATAPDIIAYAFYRMGFRPRESLVLIGMREDPDAPPERRGRRMLTGVVARVDLPPAAHRRAQVELIVSRVRGHGHRAAFALIVSDQPQPALAKAVRGALRRADLRLLDMFAVGASTYRSCECRDERCCPAEGFPLSEVETSQAAAEQVLRGRTLGEDELSLVADVLPDPDAALPLALFARPADGEPGAAAGPSSASARKARLRRLDLWRDLVADQRGEAAAPVAAGDLAELCRGLDDVLFRDALLIALAAPGGSDGLQACPGPGHGTGRCGPGGVGPSSSRRTGSRLRTAGAVGAGPLRTAGTPGRGTGPAGLGGLVAGRGRARPVAGRTRAGRSAPAPSGPAGDGDARGCDPAPVGAS